MNSVTVTKRFEFDAAHRLYQHEGACRHVHGHHYVVEVEVAGPSLNYLGMLIDFGELKQRVGDWIQEHWDHATLLNNADTVLFEALEEMNSTLYLFDGNPTAEKMAVELFTQVRELLKHTPVVPRRVRVWETPDSFAEYREG